MTMNWVIDWVTLSESIMNWMTDGVSVTHPTQSVTDSLSYTITISATLYSKIDALILNWTLLV